MRVLYFTVGVVLAALAGAYLDLSAAVLLPAGVVGLALWGLCAAVKGLKGPMKWPKAAFLGLAVTCFWMTAYAALFHAPADDLADRTVRLEAVVTDWPEETDYGLRMDVRAGEEGGWKVPAIFYGDETLAHLRPGDTIRCVAHCSPADRMGGMESLYYAANGVLLQIKGYGDMEVIQPEGIPVRYALPFLAGYLNDLIEALYPPLEAGFLDALLLGDKNGLRDQDTNNFNRVGLGHVVVISGMHVTFLLGLLSFFIKPKGKGAIALIVATLAAFSVMTGNAPGTVRAVILCGFVLVGRYLGRDTHTLVTLSYGLLFLLAWNPWAIASAGLQFSFLSTLGIFLWAQPWKDKWLQWVPKRHRKWTAPVLSLAAVSLSAMIFTVPLSVLYFGRFSLVSPLANLLVGWVTPLIFTGGILSMVLGAVFLPLGQGLAAVVSLLIDGFLWFGETVSRLDLAALTMDRGYYALWSLFVYVILLLSLFLPSKEKRPVLPVCACLCTLCLSVVLTVHDGQQAALTFTVLDVGQGQSVAVTSGDRTALIDCGGTTDPGDTAATWLQSFGRSELDLLVLTHYDADHANGVLELMSRLDVKTLALPDVDPESAQRRDIEALAAEQGREVLYIQDPTQVTLDRAELTLYPPLAGSDGGNEASMAVLCAAGDWEALVTGDLPREEEMRLAARGWLPDLELLVAGHHGSRHSTSQELLDAVTPETVVISVGYNSYGHPEEEVLDRLAGMEVYRTDRDGTVTVTVP